MASSKDFRFSDNEDLLLMHFTQEKSSILYVFHLGHHDSMSTRLESITEWQSSLHYGVLEGRGRALGRVGGEGVALGVASWMCGGGGGVGGKWSVACHLGFEF